MPQPEISGLWGTAAPDSWPEPPVDMTVSTLLEIEACPRRWALSAGAYPSLWSGRGYPQKLTVASLAGTVVHLALEKIARALVDAGCGSVQEPAAVETMKALGGYTKVLESCVQVVQARTASNPRAARVSGYIDRRLRAQVPELRARTQRLISTVRLTQPSGVSFKGREGREAQRGPLNSGVYGELELRAPAIGWKGKADLLVLAPTFCELTDFKTGTPDEAHKFQLRVYALLWNRDVELNPTQRHVDKLTLAYFGGQQDVSVPTESEFVELEAEVISRRDAAVRSVTSYPPEARPSPDNCAFCSVRHMCDEYWTSDREMAVDDSSFGDIEVIITGRHGPSSWDAVARAKAGSSAERRVLLRTADDLALRRGQTVRIVDANVVASTDIETVVVVTLGAMSEVFCEDYERVT